jgi:Domain of unknown function (DUF4401)
MSSSDRVVLWDGLRASGLVDGDLPSTPDDGAPWYVRAMIGIAGWIAACFLLAFIGAGLAFAFSTGTAAQVIGIALCAVAIALLRALGTREFVAQFALALSLAGQVLVVGGLFTVLRHQDWVVYAAIAAFEIALALAAPNAVHRTWSALAAAMALLFALVTMHLSFLFPALLAAAFVAIELNEATLSPYAGLWQPVGAGLALGLLLLVPATIAFDLLQGEFGRAKALRDMSAAWRGSALAAMVLVGAVAVLLARNGVRLGGRSGLATLGACVAFAAAAWQVPGVIAALIVVVVAFATGRRALMGLGLVALAATLFHYYYSLDATLLAKSVSLLASGAVLLAARFAARRWLAAQSSEASHA